MVLRTSALLAACALLSACEGGAPTIEVRDAWARATVAGQTGSAAYLTISNGGDGGDRLVSVRTPAAARAELHSSDSSGGVARMRPLPDGLHVPANGNARLSPGGDHLMLIGVKQPFRPGSRIELQLQFERSGERRVEALISAGTPPSEGHGHAG